MTPEEIQSLVAIGSESRHVEFKGTGSLKDKAFRAKVVRAILGMANTRDGGTVIIGVDDENGAPSLTGLDGEHRDSWSPDNLADAVNRYADPSVVLRMTPVEVRGIYVVAIQVKEFDTVPVICKMDYEHDLRRGACYVRSRRKPETVAVATLEDMRELIDIATEKSLRELLARFQDIGVSVPELVSLKEDAAEATMHALELSDQAQDVMNVPYWTVLIHPMLDSPTELAFGDLSPLMYQSAVEMGGWMYPLAHPNNAPQRFDSYVQHRIQFANKNEIWRLTQQGVFCFVGALSLDWPNYWRRADGAPVPQPLKRFPIITTLRHISAFIEFASRYTRRLPSHSAVRISLTWNGIDGAELFLDSPRRPGFMITNYDTNAPSITWTRTFATGELWARSREIAREAGSYVFERFGWIRQPETLEELQTEAIAG